MSLGKKIATVTLTGFAIACTTGVAGALPFIDWTMDPMLPGHVPNPGGALSASCTVAPDGTTLDRLEVRLTTPQGGVLQEWIVTDDLSLTIDWEMPVSYPDGIYRYEMEYFSVENGLEVALSEGFLVAGSTTGVCAFVYSDIDQDQNFEFEDGEALLPDWEVCATSGPQSVGCQLTGQDGVTCWFFITAGTYEFCETVQSFWSPTTSECVSVDVPSGGIAKVEYGNFNSSLPTEQTSWGTIKSDFR